ncbi:WAS/WASL-interacting protein family member 3-like isoform X1 [Cyprinus carpio]|uniref:WAS/WASL-interacting protein family member 3-like isoform X1 n=1 Tax=Cyprinus carpio TaxID=7962 RepID=A0A9R0BF95_CYPCA|nr:WAS/WASL-interacting protein family member 3-like isoform X1 [Cyprinus carpio]XP_042632485.1 WAS/WASL-interacting protein family member 3-like isoform X1 [Cyprinus carpio]
MPVPPPPPPPPPPPAPPPPPPPSAAPAQSRTDPPKIQRSEGGGRNALLSDIQKGTRLKKVTQVNDRSKPILDKPKGNSVDDSGRNVAAGNTAGSAPSAVGPSLSGLFAGGFPVLKPSGQRDQQPHHNPVSRSGSTASLKQPLWNPPSQGDGFRGSAPDLSPSHKPLERAFSLPKTQPISSYTAPPSPSQTTHPSFKLSSTPLSSAPPPPPPPPQERPSNRPPPLPTCMPPPPPPQSAKPTWLPVQSHSIPMPMTPPPPLPPSVPPSSLPDRSSGVFYPPPPPPPPSVPPSSLPDRSSGVFFPPPPSPGPLEIKDSPLGPPPPPPPLPASFACSHPSSGPPPLPQKVPPVPSPTYKPSVPPLPPPSSSAPSRRPPAVPRFAGPPRMAPPPVPPPRSPNTELSSRIPPPPPLPLSAPPSSVRNGHLQSLDDFESKFHFHPIEDFPPPEEFRPFPRTYPSKENRGTTTSLCVRVYVSKGVFCFCSNTLLTMLPLFI